MGFAKEGSIATDFILLKCDPLFPFMIEINRVFGVCEESVIGLDPIGDVGIDKGVILQVVLQFLGVVGAQKLQKLEQVNDLVVAPVADVRPWIVRLNGLPLKAILEHAIRIVSIESGGIEELENHALNELGIGMDQGFPVLEDVAPAKQWKTQNGKLP